MAWLVTEINFSSWEHWKATSEVEIALYKMLRFGCYTVQIKLSVVIFYMIWKFDFASFAEKQFNAKIEASVHNEDRCGKALFFRCLTTTAKNFIRFSFTFDVFFKWRKKSCFLDKPSVMSPRSIRGALQNAFLHCYKIVWISKEHLNY